MTIKTNPLFVDSTKFQGDLVSTQIELRGILLYDGESLVAVVTNHQGIAMRSPMKAHESEFSYETRIHLNHQTPITYRFVIEKNGRKALHSTLYRGRAQYAIILDWEPALREPLEESIEAQVEVSAGHLPTLPGGPLPHPSPIQFSRPADSNWARDSSMNVRNLIDKWGL